MNHWTPSDAAELAKLFVTPFGQKILDTLKHKCRPKQSSDTLEAAALRGKHAEGQDSAITILENMAAIPEPKKESPVPFSHALVKPKP